MSQISAFGIGAGRTIAGESDEDDERLRQRRLTAMQRIEQSRRGAVLRERFVQSERTHAMHAAQQQAVQQRADADMRDAQAAARQKLASNSRLAQLMPTRPAAIGGREISGNEEILSAVAPHANTSEERPLHPEAITRQLMAAEEVSLADTPSPADLSETVAVSDTKPLEQLVELADDLAEFRGPQFADKLAARLDKILSTMRSYPRPAAQPVEADELDAALGFIEGYVEAASMGQDSQQTLLQLIGELRQQLLGSEPPAPVVQSLMSAAAMTAQMSSYKGRVAGMVEGRGNGRLRSLSAERRAEAEHEAEVDAEISAALMQSSRLSPGGPVRTSQSSLSKDADKRREETLVTVTVRSV